jgi:hypothetical protein
MPPISGSGIEDFVKEKGLELASGFADSLGGENFLGRVGEDITDMFSGREIGYTERKRQEDRRAEEQAVRDEGERKEADYRQKNPDKFSAETYAREIGGKLYEEIFSKWQKKFATEDGYLMTAEDALSFGNAVRREGLRSKAEVDKFYKKTRKDALQAIKTGEPPANAVGIKDNRKSLREYWEAKARRGEGRGMSGGALSEEDRKRFKFLDNKEVLDLQTGKTFNPLDIAKKIDADISKRSDPAEFTKDLGKKMLSFYGIGSGNPFIDLGNKAVAKAGRGSTCVGKMCMTEDEEQEEAFRGQEDVELQGIEDAVSEGRIPSDLAGIIMGFIPDAGEAYIQQLLQYFGDAYADRYYNASEEEQIRMIVRMREALERHPPEAPIRPSTEVVLTRFPQPRVLPSRDDEDDEKKQGDGKPSRGYYFIRALNASKAPQNSQKASIVEWRKNNKENAERINQSKFRKFDYSKLPKGSENNALRTKNPNPVGRHPVYEPTEVDLATKRNYGGLYALKKQEKKEEKKYLTLEDLDEDNYFLYLGKGSKDEFFVVSSKDDDFWDEKGYIKLPEPKKGYASIKTLGDFDVEVDTDGEEGTNYYIIQLILTRKKKEKKEKKPKKAPQQNPEEKEEADFKEERPAPPPPEPTIDELARGHYEADKELRKAIKKRAEERFGKAEFNTALVRVRKQMQRERDKEQGVERKFK